MRRADYGGADVLHGKTPLFHHRKAFMNPQEKELLTTLLDRVKNAPRQDKDPEADALIRQAMAAQPDLPYYLTQTVLIQDLSLHQAQQRIADLEKQLADAQQAAKPTVGSFLGGLFGNRSPAQASGPAQAGPPQAGPWTRSPQVAAAPPAQPYGQPGYAPQPGYGQQPMGGGGFMGGGGMGGAGGGFLRSAAATAAGVAGGALLFQGISSLFGNHYAGGLMSGGMTPGLGESVVNNYYGNDAGGGGGDWSSDAGAAGGGGDWSSDAGAAGGGHDPGSQDFSSDQDWGGGGGDWSSGDSNTSC
jgi:hypothetical protein